MHKAYKDDKELCKWLRDNSSGDYRLAAYAAERIETLTLHLKNVNHECEKAERKVESLKEENAKLRALCKSALVSLEGDCDPYSTRVKMVIDEINGVICGTN